MRLPARQYCCADMAEVQTAVLQTAVVASSTEAATVVAAVQWKADGPAVAEAKGTEVETAACQWR